MSAIARLDDDRRLVTVLLAAIFFLGLALRLYQLDTDSLWVDEIATATWSRLDPRIIMSRAYADNLPLTYMVTRLGTALLGDTDFALRLPPALLGSASILLAYKVGERLWTRKDGLWGALLMAVNAYHVHYSQEVRHYALMVFLALLGLIFLLIALREGRVGPWVGFGLCTALGLYNHYFALLFLPAEVVLATWLMAEQWSGRRIRDAHTSHINEHPRLYPLARQTAMFAVTLVSVALCYIPRLSAIRKLAAEQAGSQPLGVTLARLQWCGRTIQEMFTVQFGAQGLVLLLWLALLLVGLSSYDRKRTVFVLLWIGTPFVFLSVTDLQIFHLRYLLFILPISLLVVGRGARLASEALREGLPRTVGARRWQLVLSWTLTALVLGGLCGPPLLNYYAEEKPDWRSAAGYMKEDLLPGDIILADGDRYKEGRDYYRVTLSLPFYLQRLGAPSTRVLPVTSRLPQTLLEGLPEEPVQIWAAVYHADTLSAERVQDAITTADFNEALIVRLRDPRGDTMRDTASMLLALLDLLPSEAHFDLRLALGGIYAQMGKCAEARAEFATAEQLLPPLAEASQDLADAFSELERSCPVSGAY